MRYNVIIIMVVSFLAFYMLNLWRYIEREMLIAGVIIYLLVDISITLKMKK